MTEQQREAFRRNIKYYLLDHDVKQKDLAEAAGVSDQFMSRVVNGDKKPPFDVVLALSRFMGVTVEDLITLKK